MQCGALLPFRGAYRVVGPEVYHPLKFLKSPALLSPSKCCLAAAVENKKLSYRRETARQLRTPLSARSLIVHLTEHRIYCTTRL